MSKTLTTALGIARNLADGLLHFVIGSIVTFGGVTLALPVVMQALKTTGLG
jgi:hypothetical protein